MPIPPLLELSDLTVRFGGITALDGVSFEVRAGQICGLIGPNGAGKTTVFNCLGRVYQPTGGDIRIDGVSILRTPPCGIATLGIARTFQNLALFDRLSVLDNVLVGGHARSRSRVWGEALRTPSTVAEDRRLRERAREQLAFVDLIDVADVPVATLPHGSRKRVELARALMAEPRVLLLDEPAGGLSVEETARLESLLRTMRDDFGTSLLLVEHRIGLVLSLCDHLVVLNFGRKIAEGDPRTVASHPAVVEAYLGTGA